MNQRNVVIHVCTVYQLVVAVYLDFSVYKEDRCVLVISKSTPNSLRVFEQVKKTNLFEDVVLIDNEVMDWNKSIYSFAPITRRQFYPFVKGTCLADKHFDVYAFAGLGGFSNALGQWLIKKNPNIEIEMFEEGASSYSNIYGDAIKKRSTNSSRMKALIYSVYPHILARYKKFYYFCPELVLWGDKSKIDCLEPISDAIKDAFRNSLNTIFDYDELKDSYSEKVIFFEESYAGDGLDVGDVELVERLALVYGKENIFVKTHPRNKINRFASLGYKTNKDYSIPWEIVALNMESIDTKILVTMTSTAVISSFLLLHSNAKMMFVTENMPQNDYRVFCTIEVIDKLKTLYKDRFLNRMETE